MRIMGLDYGKKRIGVALSDEARIIAQPFTLLTRVSAVKDIEEIKRLIVENHVERVVIGHPVNMDGTLGKSALEVEAFAERLKTSASVPIELWDERLSTVAVTRILIDADVSRVKRKENVDKLSACYMLQGYLDRAAKRAPSGD
ncbi:MAG: Holliday junction resolvase RuvX [Deltaproteobacteria bacterium]|nr:Holliday junction resolvase RuvX [Deltaproteobacteria bacterium]